MVGLGTWLVVGAADAGCGGNAALSLAAGTTGAGGVGAAPATGGGGGSGGSDGGSDGSDGGAAVCAPGATSACYSGPAGTENVGTCKAGVQTCAADGSGFGPCVGEVTPQPEDCATAANEDCSGGTAACAALTWAGRYGGVWSQAGTGIDVDAAGEVAVTGFFMGKLDLGAGALSAGSAYELFVAKFGLGGQLLWSHSWSNDNAYDHQGGVALDPAGNVFLTGTTSATIDFGGGPRCVTGGDQTFLAKFDAQGNHLWSRCFGDAMQATGNRAAVAADAAGNVALAATTYGGIDFGTGPLESGIVVVASYDPDGNPRWAEALGGTGDEEAIPFSVAVDLAGNVLVGGVFSGTADFGLGPLDGGNDNDAFVFLLDPGGSPLWSRALGGKGNQNARWVAASATGYLVASDAAFASIDLGGGQVVPQTGPAPIVAAFDATGQPVWSWGLGLSTTGGPVACGAGGDVFVLPQTAIPNPDGGLYGTSELGMARLTAAGNLVSSQAFGSGEGLGMAARGPWLALTGTAGGPVDVGGGALVGSGDEDVLIAVMAP